MKFSFIIPLHENVEDIQECLHSICIQKDAEVECIVVGSANVLESLRHRTALDKRVALMEMKGAFEPTEAIQLGIEKVRGDIFCIMEPSQVLIGDTVLAKIAQAFEEYSSNVLYGKGLLHSGNDILDTLRLYGSKPHRQMQFPFGKIPLHTLIFYHRSLYIETIQANELLESEYELHLKLFMSRAANVTYLDEFVVKLVIQESAEKPQKPTKASGMPRFLQLLHFKKAAFR